MKIVVTNCNTTQEMTEEIVRGARAAAGPGTTVTGLTPAWGPESAEGWLDSYLSAAAVIDLLRTYEGPPYDAVVMAGFGEHGREGVRELVDVPVVDITEAAASTAQFLGRSYSVVTSLDRTVPLIEERLHSAGLSARCASVRASGLAVLDLERDETAAVEAIVEQAARAVEEDRAEVICLGCGGMSGLTERVVDRTGVPVVDGVTAAVTIAESLVRLGLSTSKVRTYAPPRPKKFVNWPPRPR
jgi:allantoin racemase